MNAVRLESDQLAELADLVAARVLELLEHHETKPTSGLLDAAALARALGVSRAAVYEHAAELGAVKLGAGDRPRLRFDLERAREAWTRSAADVAPPTTPAAAVTRRPRRRDADGDDLLPIVTETGTRGTREQTRARACVRSAAP